MDTARQSFSTPGEKAGLALVAATGLASALCSGALVVYIAWNSFRRSSKSRPLRTGIQNFARSGLGCYLLSLLLCDFLQGVAFMLNFRWSALGHMETGTLCTIQGAVSQVGDMGAAVWSMVIAFHTFWLLFLIKKPHPLAAPIVLTVGWVILIVLPIIGPYVLRDPQRGPFYNLTGAWCWVGTGYGRARIAYLYGWIFAALATSIVTYTLIYLRFSNFITTDDDGSFKINFRRPKASHTNSGASISQTETRRSRRLSSSTMPGCFSWAKDNKDQAVSSGSGSDQMSEGTQLVSNYLRRIAARLMWYPIVYAIVVIPVSVCRMGVLAGWTPPFAFFVVAGMLFGSSGITNSILFITTRHNFIMQVTQANSTRVHITTQRVTVREDWISTGDGNGELELKEVSPLSGSTKHSDLLDSIESLSKSKVTIMDHGPIRENGDTDGQHGIQISVLGR